MDSPQALKSLVGSEPLKNNTLPYWAALNQGGIVFRGTYHELKSSELILTLYNKVGFTESSIGTKIVQLREVIDINFAKTDMVIHR